MMINRATKKTISPLNNTRLFKIYSLLLLILATSQTVSGLDNRIEFERIFFEEGQVKTSVWAIAQDSTGFMWFGTNNGLYKYDAYTFKRFTHSDQDSTTLLSNIVRNLVIDQKNNLWVQSSSKTLSRFISKDGTFVHYFNDPADSALVIKNTISSFVVKNDTIWIGTFNSGLYRYALATNELENIYNESTPDNPISGNWIHSLFIDNNYLWIGTNKGLDRFNLKTAAIKHFDLRDPIRNIPSNSIKAVCKDLSNSIWVGTYDGNLFKYNSKTDSFTKNFSINAEDPASKNMILSLSCDRSNRLWIGNSWLGLACFEQNKNIFTFATKNPDKIAGIDRTHIQTIFTDRTGVIWIGTTLTGLYKQKPVQQFHHYLLTDTPDSLRTENNIQAIYKDSNEVLYIGTNDDGLYVIEPNKEILRHFLHDADDSTSITDNSVFDIFEDSNNNLWLATNDGLDKFIREENRFIHYKLSPGDLKILLSKLDANRRDGFFKKCNRFRGIYEDQKRNLWIGSFSGILARFDYRNSKFYTYRHLSDRWQSSDGITTIAEDAFGKLWIGTVSNGIQIFNPKTCQYIKFFHKSSLPDSLPSEFITTIFRDNSDEMWVGTLKSGLSRYNYKNNSFKSYRDTDGLPSNRVAGILEDENHNLWISTAGGLSKFDRETGSITNFSLEDGVDYYKINIDATDFTLKYNPIMGEFFALSNKMGFRSCSFKFSENEFYFGGNNGYIVFNPADLYSKKGGKQTANIVLTDFRIFKESRKLDYNNKIKNINLTYKDYIFSFDFSLLDFTSPTENQYSFLLEGFEKKWGEASTNRSVTYWNILPGKYTLKVKACSKYGSWTEMPLAINITITPPFWKTWWFMTLMALTVAGVVGYIVWLWIAHIQKQKIELEKMVRQRTSELHETNKQLVKEVYSRKKVEKELRKSEEEFRDLFENANDIIWTSNTNGVILTINRFFQELLGYSREQIIGTNLLDYISIDHRFRAIRNFFKFQKSHILECELNIITKNRETRIIWVKVRGIFDNEKYVGIHGIGRDVTELKKTQAELQEAERLKRESIKQLTLKLAHEIKNPLASITSSAQLVASSKDNKDNPKIQRHMGVINKNVDICNRVIRDLYTFTHKPKLNLTLISVADFTNNLLNYAREITERRPRIRVLADIEEKIPSVRIDEFRMLQAFKNLINNAFEAMSDEGILTIHAGYNPPNNEVFIEIGDTGCGMTDEELNNAFREFYSSKPTGFGLGIPLVKDIVDAHSGTFYIKSEKNVGTVFTIKLLAGDSV